MKGKIDKVSKFSLIIPEGISIVKHMVDWSHSNIDSSKKFSIFETTLCEFEITLNLI